MSRTAIGLGFIALTLALAPAALAAQASVTELPGAGSDVLRYDGGIDAQNTTITFNPGGVPDFRVRETGSIITAGSGCSKISSDTVSCPSAGIGLILATLGLANDRIDVSEGILLPATLDGDGGDDVLIAGGGDDLVRGDLGDDTLHGRSGDDELNVGGSVAQAFEEELTGGAGDDTLVGANGDDTLSGGDGNDSLNDIAGADDVSGDSGVDTARFEILGPGPPGVTADLDDAPDDGLAGQGANIHSDVENLVGTDRADVLIGNGSSNELRGGEGADKLFGGPGGTVPDVLNGGGGRDLADYGGRTEPLVLRAAALGGTTGNGASGEGDALSGIEDVRGGLADDTLRGDAGANQLDGNAGNDRLDGGAGDDQVRGGPGTDTADYSSRTEAVQASLAGGEARSGTELDALDQVENLVGGSERDQLEGSSVNNVLRGGTGGDTLRGLGGSDLLIPGPGIVSDTLEGGEGPDTLDYSDRGEDLVVDLTDAQGLGGQGAPGEEDRVASSEHVIGGSGDDVLVGDQTANRLAGSGGSDKLDGLGGSDELLGEGGPDRVTARDGAADIVTCGDASDTALVDATGDQVDSDCEAVDLPGPPEVTILSRRLRPDARGFVRIKLGCGPETCGFGRLTLESAKKVQDASGRRRVRLARERFAIEPGRTRIVRTRLSGRNRRLVARLSPLAVRVVAVAVDAVGERSKATREVTLTARQGGRGTR